MSLRLLAISLFILVADRPGSQPVRHRISINDGWRFLKYNGAPDMLMYDVRPDVTDRNDSVAADTRPTAPVVVNSSEKVLKKWILPTANDFFNDPAKHHRRPDGNPGADFPFVKNDFNDDAWERVVAWITDYGFTRCAG